MADDDRIILIGEDLRDPYGGAFKVTAGLSDKYDDRVRNAPISEAGIVGIGNGLALAGWKPVVEIMFGDFIMLAADQIINHATEHREQINSMLSALGVAPPDLDGWSYGEFTNTLVPISK